MNPSHVQTRILACGNSGSGKTSWAVEMLKKWRALRIVFDPEGDFASRLGLPCYETPDEIATAFGRDGIACVNLTKDFPGNRAGAFEHFCKATFRLCEHLNGPKVMVADEVQAMVNPKKSMPCWLARIMDEGRKHELDTLFVSNAVNRTHEAIRNQITMIAAFRTPGKRQQEWLSDWGDFDPVEIANLGRGQFVIHNLDTDTWKRSHRNDAPSR